MFNRVQKEGGVGKYLFIGFLIVLLSVIAVNFYSSESETGITGEVVANNFEWDIEEIKQFCYDWTLYSQTWRYIDRVLGCWTKGDVKTRSCLVNANKLENAKKYYETIVGKCKKTANPPARNCISKAESFAKAEAKENLGDILTRDVPMCKKEKISIASHMNQYGPCGTFCYNFCGDGTLQKKLGEECDDGNTVDGEGCSSKCVKEFCGDTIVQIGLNEECDDGNLIDNDMCISKCKTARCGDGILQSILLEECDDGNTVDDDTCRNTCKRGFCGDWVVQKPMEDCDPPKSYYKGGWWCDKFCKSNEGV